MAAESEFVCLFPESSCVRLSVCVSACLAVTLCVGASALSSRMPLIRPESRGYVVTYDKAPAGPAKKRSSRIGFLFLAGAGLLFCIGMFTDDWIVRKNADPNTDIHYGLWHQVVTTKQNNQEITVSTPLGDAQSQNIPDFDSYLKAANSGKGLGLTAIAIGGIGVLLSFPVMLSVGPSRLDLLNSLVVFLSFLFMLLAYVIYDAQRPKSDANRWNDYDPSTSFFCVIAGSVLGFVSVVFLCLGKR